MPYKPPRRRALSAPIFVEPMAAHPVKVLPEGDEWLYELKLDGLPDYVVVTRNRIFIAHRTS